MAELMRKIDPTSEVLWLALRIERKLGDAESESRYATQLRRRFPASNEYQRNCSREILNERSQRARPGGATGGAGAGGHVVG